MISRHQVFAVVPVLKPVDTDEIAFRVYDRFQLVCDYDAVEEIRPTVARRLRDLRAAGRVSGGPAGWQRAGR